jgi:hypothetical protein
VTRALSKDNLTLRTLAALAWAAGFRLNVEAVSLSETQYGPSAYPVQQETFSFVRATDDRPNEPPKSLGGDYMLEAA